MLTSGERRALQLGFLASYLMLLVGFHTGASSDPLILSLGLGAKLALGARIALGGMFLVLSLFALARLLRRFETRAMVAPLALLLTQFLWFVLPTLVELASGTQIPQTRYSSGILAVLHSTQYLWVTSYYARREAKASGETAWSASKYFAILLIGGIALFIPGPWLVSYIFRYDFTVSFLIFTALVNIHHFILDGAIWKLRDARIAAVLVDDGGRIGAAAPPGALRGASIRHWLARGATPGRVLRVSLAAVLIVWGLFDQAHYFLSTDESDLSRLLRAAALNPYDSSLQMRIARADARAGKLDESVEALTRAVAANPRNPLTQHARARALLDSRRYAEAYEQYRQMLAVIPRDPDALVNFGVLASQLGRLEEAMESWQKAVAVDSAQASAHLYLAEALDRQNQPAAAARHYEAYLQLVAAHPEVRRTASTVAVMIEFADALSRTRQSARALEAYQSALAAAEKARDTKLESLALVHRAELEEKGGNAAAARRSFQRGLALDARLPDARSEAIDWFNYGQFLRRQGRGDQLSYACLLRAESLLATTPGPEFQTVTKIRQQTEARLGRKALAIRKNLSAYLAEAALLDES